MVEMMLNEATMTMKPSSRKLLHFFHVDHAEGGGVLLAAVEGLVAGVIDGAVNSALHLSLGDAPVGDDGHGGCLGGVLQKLAGAVERHVDHVGIVFRLAHGIDAADFERVGAECREWVGRG